MHCRSPHPQACLADPPPILLAGSTGGGEAMCDLRCAASPPMLIHVPLVVDALRISRRGNRKEKISGFSLRGSHMPSLISLSTDLANSLQSHQGRFFVCVFLFSFFDVSACSRYTALLLGYNGMPLSGDPSELCQVCVFLKKQQASPRMRLLWG